MLGDASDFTPLDMLGSLAINAVATDRACRSEAFRVGISKTKIQIRVLAVHIQLDAVFI